MNTKGNVCLAALKKDDTKKMRRALQTRQAAHFVRHDGTRTRIGVSDADGSQPETDPRDVKLAPVKEEIEEQDSDVQDEDAEDNTEIRYRLQFQFGRFPRLSVVR